MDEKDRSGRAVLALQEELKRRSLYGYIVTSDSEHGMPSRLERISNFASSNAIAVVCTDKLFFFTDSRYLLQAQCSLGGEWNVSDLKHLPQLHLEGDIGYDAAVLKKGQLTLFYRLQIKAIEENLVDFVAPCKAESVSILDYEGEYSGQARSERLLECMALIKGSGFLFLADAACINWILNIRSSSIPYTLVFPCFALLSSTLLHLFVEDPSEVQWLAKCNLIRLRHASKLEEFAKANSSARCAIEFSVCTLSTLNKLSHMKLVEAPNPILLKKAIKNSVELNWAKQRHIEDAVALCEVFALVEEIIRVGNVIDEYAVCLLLEKYRARNSAYIGPSFSSICGFNENGAAIHYRAPRVGSKVLSNSGILLVDSGGNYLGATTDVTRNLAFDSSKESRFHYTTVLKGHIALATTRFPIGASGAQLDSIARAPLWNQGLEYAHATGHGVSNCLGVHEGPCAIAPGNSTKLQEGMIVSNEPGFYKPGCYGIRVENLCFVRACAQHSQFLVFEQLTLVPYCGSLIQKSMLSESELSYLYCYYSGIEKLVMPHLSKRAKDWFLKEMNFID